MAKLKDSSIALDDKFHTPFTLFDPAKKNIYSNVVAQDYRLSQSPFRKIQIPRWQS